MKKKNLSDLYIPDIKPISAKKDMSVIVEEWKKLRKSRESKFKYSKTLTKEYNSEENLLK